MRFPASAILQSAFCKLFQWPVETTVKNNHTTTQTILHIDSVYAPRVFSYYNARTQSSHITNEEDHSQNIFGASALQFQKWISDYLTSLVWSPTQHCQEVSLILMDQAIKRAWVWSYLDVWPWYQCHDSTDTGEYHSGQAQPFVTLNLRQFT